MLQGYMLLVKQIGCWWHAAANIMVAVRKPTEKRSDEPWWKRRIKQKILMQLRKDISRLLAKVSNWSN